MHKTSACRRISEFPRPATTSFAALRWVAEEEVTEEAGDDDGESEDQGCRKYFEEKPMFEVVGEQYRLEAVEAAAIAIAEESSFLPARFWLLCEEDNPHDQNAVSVHAVVKEYSYHVGFMSRHNAEEYRRSLAAIGHPNETVEVVGCFTQGKDKAHARCRLFLPMDFAQQWASGANNDPRCNPAWLRDPSPVQPRPFQGPNAAGFTDDELRKIFCRFAKRKRWFGLPNHCDSAVGSYRHRKMSEELEEFFIGFGQRVVALQSSTPDERPRGLTNPQSIGSGSRETSSKHPTTSRSRPTVVAEEKIDLRGSVLEREDPRDFENTILASVFLTMVRRTSERGNDVDVKGILRFEVEDDGKRRPFLLEADLADLPGLVEALCDSVHAIANRPSQEAKVSLSVQVGRQMAILACTGERRAFRLQANRVEMFLHVKDLHYRVTQCEPFMHSLVRAAGDDKELRRRVDEALAILRVPAG